MTDFWQHGMITTLQKLGDRPIEEIERELRGVGKERKIVLLLLALFSEFETPSMPRITIEKYHALALLNGIPYDRHEEVESVESFVGALRSSIHEFVQDPIGVPMLPAWVRIAAAVPDFQERLDNGIEGEN
jgi:hypothetical protein